MADKIFIEWLKAQHEEIMGYEQKANEALDNGDKVAYAKYMHEKTFKLKELYARAKAQFPDLPSVEKSAVEQTLSRFSASAATALHLNSLFYMSALLYRDDHKVGEPDNLEVLIETLEK